MLGLLILNGLLGELPRSERMFCELSGLADEREGRGGLWMMNRGEVAEGDMMEQAIWVSCSISSWSAQIFLSLSTGELFGLITWRFEF